MDEHQKNIEETKAETGHRAETFGRGLATVGLIILLILGAWGIIILAFDAPDFLSRVGNNIAGIFGHSTTTPAEPTSPGTPASQTETLTVSADGSSVESGKSITVSWQDQGATGSRGFLVGYACQDGLTMDAPLPNGTYRSVPCNTAFNYTNAQSSVTLRPHLSGTTPQPAVISIAAISLETGSTTAVASASVTVNASGPATAKPKPTTSATKTTKSAVTTTYTPPQKKYVQPYGYPDLSVRILAVGYINPQTGALMPTNNAYSYNGQYPGMLAVQFDIRNVGTNVAPAGWQFSVTLPGSNAQTPYVSGPQQALAPGSGVVTVLKWSPQNTPQCYQNCTPCQWNSGYQYQNQNQNCGCVNNNYNNYNYPNNYYPQQNNCGCLASSGYPTSGTACYNDQQNYQPYYPGSRQVTIVVDQNYQLQDRNRSNNTAQIAF